MSLIVVLIYFGIMWRLQAVFVPPKKSDGTSAVETRLNPNFIHKSHVFYKLYDLLKTCDRPQ